MCEIWEKVPGFGNYIVSNRIKVINTKRKTEKKIFKTSDGHLAVVLWKNNKAYTIGIHRILALAFLPVPEHLKNYPIEKLIVHHINENKEDNRIENLMWVTEEMHRQIHDNIPVERYTLNNEFVDEWESAMEVERVLGFDQSNVSKCCRGIEHYNTAYGYIWKFKEPQAS